MSSEESIREVAELEGPDPLIAADNLILRFFPEGRSYEDRALSDICPVRDRISASVSRYNISKVLVT